MSGPILYETQKLIGVPAARPHSTFIHVVVYWDVKDLSGQRSFIVLIYHVGGGVDIVQISRLPSITFWKNPSFEFLGHRLVVRPNGRLLLPSSHLLLVSCTSWIKYYHLSNSQKQSAATILIDYPKTMIASYVCCHRSATAANHLIYQKSLLLRIALPY